MFGPKLTTVFASRWNALIWSAGILATAYCSVPSAEETHEAKKAEAAQQAHHRSPWAKDPG
ncbi:MAG: hypothetical protein ABIQ81_03095 [Novosphingobium sp.]